MPGTATGYETYKKVNVETASQGKLIVMLFNGAIQRAEEAKRQIAKGNIEGVHNNLIRAQQIVGELRGALNMNAGGEIAQNLDRIYEYYQHLFVMANLRKDIRPIDECIAAMTDMRNTWQELFLRLAQEEPQDPASVNRHGCAVLNMQG